MKNLKKKLGLSLAVVLSSLTIATAYATTFTNVVYLDYPSIEEAHKVSKDEMLVIYRDLFRVSGIWQYPGLQR
ncbi:hypothetical protein [Parageobacillus sp. G301]|jgi:hypothetical protein|uniref:hypothetical protein n=1 Tax=Parageobacillus sp. G301 TaxID=2998290 RepID=UPI002498B352|nr:hypothetical protein [Parageobacillus sp. G301]GLH62915.1 hypothetical protein PG301_07540 [Parageobacillus sp. G301]